LLFVNCDDSILKQSVRNVPR